MKMNGDKRVLALIYLLVEKKTERLGFDDISKYLKLDKKLIEFVIMRILLAILLLFIPNYHFD